MKSVLLKNCFLTVATAKGFNNEHFDKGAKFHKLGRAPSGYILLKAENGRQVVVAKDRYREVFKEEYENTVFNSGAAFYTEEESED